MSYEERTALAREIAEILRDEGVHTSCPLGLTSAEIEGIKLIGKIAKIGGSVAFVTAVGLFVTGLCGVFVLGIVGWFKSKI